MTIVLRITNHNKKNFAKCLDVNKTIRILNQVKKQKHKNKGDEMTNETEIKYPIEVFNKQGKQIYYEVSNGYWAKYEYDTQGNKTHYKDSNGDWANWKYDTQGNPTYYRDSIGYWVKYEYDEQNNITYYENTYGEKRGTPKNTH